MKRGRWTPDTARVREWYATWPTTSADTRVVPDHLAEFDRWLTAHDREVVAQALRDAADWIEDIGRHMRAEGATPPYWQGARDAHDSILRRLRDRADRMARGER